MSKDLQDRLARTEERLSRLHDSVSTLLRSRMEFLDEHGLLIAKAQDSSAVKFATGDLKRLNALEAKVHKLEGRLDQACDELGAHIGGEAQAREAYARQTMLEEEHAEQTLAKAVSAGRRRATPEGILERADKVLSDPTQVGEVAAYVSSGQLAKAVSILERAEAQNRKQDEDEAHERVVTHLDEGPSVSQLAEQLADLQHSLNDLLSRLSKLERRQGASTSQTVAKASGTRRPTKVAGDPRETAQGLLTRAEGVVDSPARIGQISSLVQAGRLDEARAIIEKAELQHEADLKKRERRAL